MISIVNSRLLTSFPRRHDVVYVLFTVVCLPRYFLYPLSPERAFSLSYQAFAYVDVCVCVCVNRESDARQERGLSEFGSAFYKAVGDRFASFSVSSCVVSIATHTTNRQAKFRLQIV